jgi:hypothetical protein
MIENDSKFFKITPYTFSLLFIFLLLIKASVAAFIILNHEVGLSPDEAQYWTWSQALDWGYYSKPPMIGWQIALTTFLFGNTEWGIRSGAVLISFLASMAVYNLAKHAGLSPQARFWAGIIAAFSPFGFFLSFASTTDGGMVLFFVLALIAIVRGPHYILVGLFILLGALYKWHIFILWPVLGLFCFFYPHLRKKSFLLGLLISLLALLPALYWNAHHEWATFKHVFRTVAKAAGSGKKGGNFLDFLGSQIGLLSPLYFAFLVISWGFFFRKLKRLSFGLMFSISISLGLLVFLALSIFNKIQPNWAAFVYPGGMLGIAWVLDEKIPHGRKWFIGATILSLLMCIGGLLIPYFQQKSLFSIPYKINPFRQNVGWDVLERDLASLGYDPKMDFLFSDKYQMASLLSFYSPGQKRAYFFNISESRKNQFSYWPQMEEREKGKTGYFVVSENIEDDTTLAWFKEHYLTRLTPYFQEVTYLGVYPLYWVNGKPVKYAFIFKGFNYNGSSPPVISVY